MTIDAAVLADAGGAFEIRPVELGALSPDEVLVKIAGVGICHTDLAVRDRVIPVPLPSVLGHEASGVIAKVGSAVTGLSPGDAVVLSFLSCGACSACEDSAPGYCEFFAPLNFRGARMDGTTAISDASGAIGSHYFGQSSFATYAIAHERNAVKVESHLPLEYLGPLGCGFLTGAGTVLQALDCAPRSSVAIFGAGPVGLASVMAAAARGCSDIVVVDPLQSRRDVARELGATAAIDPAVTDDVAGTVRSFVQRGVDYSIDTTGVPTVISAAIDALAKRGTCALLAAPKTAGATVEVRFGQVASNGSRIIGVMEGDSDPQRFIPELLAMNERGEFPFERLVQFYPFREIEHAISEQAAGRCVKAILTMEEFNV